MQSQAMIETDSAKRYLGQFVKHFAHKLPFVRAETNESGEVRFPLGLCELTADETALKISVSADAPADIAALQDVVSRHLVRFAFHEELHLDWRQAA